MAAAASRRRVALHINRRRRRDSLRGYPDLHQTHRVAIGGSLSVVDNFPDRSRPVTFKFRCSRTADDASGTIFTLGGQGLVGFDGGNLYVETGGSPEDAFTGSFVGVPRWHAEVVVALLPATGQVRAWVDSDLVIAGTVSTFPFSWATSGQVEYDGLAGVEVLDDLDVFDGQLPHHFFQVATGGAGVPAADDLLYRAAILTNLATSRVPFMEKPD